ncbi:MAG TPA: DUF5671 domain-containing protein [Bryobacteraceae bacterium]|jgi:hypothetical protein
MRNVDDLKLHEFVEAAKSKGASDEFLATFLARRGWPQDDVYLALGQYWEHATGLAVPDRSGAGESSRDAFLYLLSFSTLATWAGALGSMLFRLIDLWLPDPVGRETFVNVRTAVTWQMASIVVAFPVFLLVTRTILREAQDRPERLQSGVRKWLTYIALLLTAGGMICDLIWFVDYFLTGELTSRFVLKALTVMLICGAIFVYYLSSLRWDRDTNFSLARRRSLKFGVGATAAVVVAFALGLGVAGTPAAQRRVEADVRRTQDLQSVARAIHFWYEREKGSGAPLPASLTDLVGKGLQRSQTLDPETRTTYEYRVRNGSAYELCGVFVAAEEAGRGYRSQFWYHGPGRNCFSLDAAKLPEW